MTSSVGDTATAEKAASSHFRQLLAGAARHRQLLLAAALAGLLVAAHGPSLLAHVQHSNSRWSYADDARMWLSPLFADEDASLFPGDPIVAYVRDNEPVGFRLLYRIFGAFLGVGVFSKVLPYALLVVVLGSLASATQRLGSRAAVPVALSLALGSEYLLGRMAGGLPRAFALPLLAAGAACLVHGRARGLALVSVLAAGLYPVVAPTLVAAFALLMLLPAEDRGGASGWSWRVRIAAVAAVAMVAALVVVPGLVSVRGWGTTITAAMSERYPELGPGGRLYPDDRPPFPMLPAAVLKALALGLTGAGKPFLGTGPLASRAAAVLPFLFLAGAAGLLLLARKSQEARRFLILPIAIVISHSLSLLLYPRLYNPERHVAYGAVVVGMIAIPSAVGAFVREGKGLRSWLPLAWGLVVLALIGGHGSKTAGLSVMIQPPDREFFRRVRELPTDALVAGWPGEDMDNLPYLSKRSVFVSRETHLPWHTRYTDLMRERTFALIDAYYATSVLPLKTLRDKYGVTHLLLDRRNYTTRASYFAPFDRRATDAFRAGSARSFAALESARRAAVFELEGRVLLDLSRL